MVSHEGGGKLMDTARDMCLAEWGDLTPNMGPEYLPTLFLGVPANSDSAVYTEARFKILG